MALEDCKTFLKKHKLRLQGTKDVLLARIKEHLELKIGGGEKKYPVSSFRINCKGDACTGDVVMFVQTISKKSGKKESRSGDKGPQKRTRTVAGRIIKESYGTQKQQHTFTIEVLWSKGKEPLTPLYPLRIKGRKLYKFKTMRQRWENEEERTKVLSEKHERGDVARLDRDKRIQERENRNIQRENRMKDKSEKHEAEFTKGYKGDATKFTPNPTKPIESIPPRKLIENKTHIKTAPTRLEPPKLMENKTHKKIPPTRLEPPKLIENKTHIKIAPSRLEPPKPIENKTHIKIAPTRLNPPKLIENKTQIKIAPIRLEPPKPIEDIPPVKIKRHRWDQQFKLPSVASNTSQMPNKFDQVKSFERPVHHQNYHVDQVNSFQRPVVHQNYHVDQVNYLQRPVHQQQYHVDQVNSFVHQHYHVDQVNSFQRPVHGPGVRS